MCIVGRGACTSIWIIFLIYQKFLPYNLGGQANTLGTYLWIISSLGKKFLHILWEGKLHPFWSILPADGRACFLIGNDHAKEYPNMLPKRVGTMSRAQSGESPDLHKTVRKWLTHPIRIVELSQTHGGLDHEPHLYHL